jgi:hypothetical protein
MKGATLDAIIGTSLLQFQSTLPMKGATAKYGEKKLSTAISWYFSNAIP